MKFTRFLHSSLIVLSAHLLSGAEQPNILFILVDDLGWADVGYQNSNVGLTPHVDRLASEGVVFSAAYASPVCSPSRAEIMTGRSPASLKLTSHIPGVGFERYYALRRKALKKNSSKLFDAEITDHLHLDEVTIAEALKAAGYKTGFFGKWHLAGAGSQLTEDGMVNPDWHPQHQGFDVNIAGNAYGQPGGKVPYFSPYANGEIADGPDGEYLTDRLADETIAFISDQSEAPFFAYLSFYTVHTPHKPKPGLEGRATKKADRMLIAMDDAVGRVLAAIEGLGLSDDTLVVFTSDNGGLKVRAPLRGKKGSVYEGGVRVPLVYRWPGKVQAGTRSDLPVAAADFFPTLLEAAGANIPSETKRLDGRSYFSEIVQAGSLKARPLYQHFPHHRGGKVFKGASSIIEGDWKLIWNHAGDHMELYNLKVDIGEKTNLASQHPERVQSLKASLDKWLEHTEANMPRPF
ncbi:MAG: sulfatase [Opitutales bacterium]